MIMSKVSLENIKNIHMIGIGGSGMCPLAEILLSKGYHITGSDCNESDTLERIKSYGKYRSCYRQRNNWNSSFSSEALE